MDDSPSATLRRLVNGYQASQAIHVAATLGVADHLADGPRTSDELAAAVGAHAESLYRLFARSPRSACCARRTVAASR